MPDPDNKTWGKVDPKPMHLPFMKAQVEILTQLRDHLNGILDSDKDSLARLKEHLSRLQRGGGV